jgi:hypothetical protein
MNLRTQLFILGFVLILIIMISLIAASDPLPYSKDTLFAKQFPYEGFSEYAPSASVEKKTESNDAVKTEGFESLTPAPFGTDKPIDIYSQLSGSKGCAPSPYSNSEGYLCLDSNASSMLSTRGGNATGKESQIGTASA